MKVYALHGTLAGMPFTSVRRVDSFDAMRAAVIGDHPGVEVCCVEELPKDCACRAHEGPHWFYLDEADRARVSKAAGLTAEQIQQLEDKRLHRKRVEIGKLQDAHGERIENGQH